MYNNKGCFHQIAFLFWVIREGTIYVDMGGWVGERNVIEWQGVEGKYICFNISIKDKMLTKWYQHLFELFHQFTSFCNRRTGFQLQVFEKGKETNMNKK